MEGQKDRRTAKKITTHSIIGPFVNRQEQTCKDKITPFYEGAEFEMGRHIQQHVVTIHLDRLRERARAK